MPAFGKPFPLAAIIMKYPVMSIVIAFLCSCKHKELNWQTIDFGAFRLSAPSNWKKFTEKGIDSYVGGLTNGNDSLWFDFGWYSAEINDERAREHLYGQDTISGLIAIIQIPKIDGHGSIRMSIPHVNERDKFNLRGDNINETAMVLRIFKSVVFKNTDSTKNGRLSIYDFTQYPFGSGQTLFNAYCSTCHSLSTDLIGPPLRNALRDRDSDWLYSFLKKKNQKQLEGASSSDKEHDQIKWFDSLTKNDIHQITGYIKGQ
jgi:hypothetical protein